MVSGALRVVAQVPGIAHGIARVLPYVRPYLPTALLILLIIYFAMSAFTGDRGLLSSNERDEALVARRHELSQLQAQRADLEQRARLLRDTSLSRDLLEERARSGRCAKLELTLH